MNLLCVGAFFSGLRDGLKFSGLGVVADVHPHTGGFEVIAQDFFFLWRRAFMHSEQTGVLALQNKVGAF